MSVKAEYGESRSYLSRKAELIVSANSKLITRARVESNDTAWLSAVDHTRRVESRDGEQGKHRDITPGHLRGRGGSP